MIKDFLKEHKDAKEMLDVAIEFNDFFKKLNLNDFVDFSKKEKLQVIKDLKAYYDTNDIIEEELNAIIKGIKDYRDELQEKYSPSYEFETSIGDLKLKYSDGDILKNKKNISFIIKFR